MKLEQYGLNLIKRFETFKAEPYLCPAGKPTIGYGNTFYEDSTKVTLNDAPITEERASELLEFVANDFAQFVFKYIRVPITQKQFDALVSFTYNVGTNNFRRSTLLKKLNREDYVGASKEFSKWRRSNGKILKGLVARRKAERELFEMDI